MTNQLYIITGGPGVGKTTLLDKLKREGFLTAPEEARRIIKEEMMTNGDGLPWKNKERYAALMFEASVETYKKIKNAGTSEPVFFDRGLLDTICYMSMENIPVLQKQEAAAQDLLYNKKVFILPPWKEIYETDSERKQNWNEALFTFDKMNETYLKYDYTVIEVPKDTLQNRYLFILNQIDH